MKTFRVTSAEGASAVFNLEHIASVRFEYPSTRDLLIQMASGDKFTASFPSAELAKSAFAEICRMMEAIP